MSLGATLFIAPTYQLTELANYLVKQKITAMVATPIPLSGMVSALIKTGRKREHALRFVLVGGKNFSPIQKEQALDALGPVVYEYYGSTETGINTIAEPEDLRQYPRSVGRPFSGNRVVVIDDHAHLAPVRTPGRIAVSSYLLMDAYADGSANEVSINSERFLVTTDHGYLDEDGRLYIFNRSSEQAGDIDIYTLEDQLRQFDDVEDVAIGIKSASGIGEKHMVECALVLERFIDDHDFVIEAARRIFSEAGIDHCHIRVVSKIPYSLSGKVRWGELNLLLGSLADCHWKDATIGQNSL